MDRKREIEKRDGVRLAKPGLFPASDFPPPASGGKLKSCLYRVSEDADHHMYGLAFDRLDRHEYRQAAENKWKVFPAHGDIREAR